MTTQTLAAHHLAHLHASAIADDVIHERGYYSLSAGDTTSAAQLLGVKPAAAKAFMHGGALVLPLRRLGDPQPAAFVLRPDMPRQDRKGKPIKYEHPRQTPNILDALPRQHDLFGDPTRPLWLTEGAKKCDALVTALGDRAAVINLNGVWGWRTTNAQGGKVASPDLDHIAFNGREVILCPDGDYKTTSHVQNAINRLARLLAARSDIGTIWLCSLPQAAGGAKVGADDFLASGGTADQLLSFLTPLLQAQSQTRVSFIAHPDTGAQLLAPVGYDVRAQTIVKVDPTGATHHVYSGAIFVRSIGRDVKTDRHTVTIAWNTSQGLRERTVTADTLSNRRAFSEQIGGAGATVHEGNIKQVMSFLGEFMPTNDDAIPHRLESSTYGVVGDGLVLADRAIGFDGPVSFTGDGPRITAGTDHDAYGKVLEAAAGWNAHPLYMTLSAALAGPVVARLRPRRNPALYLAGESNGGKTTIASFAIGAFGNPEAAPLLMQGARSTTAGLFQTLERLGGLPLLIDEAHTAHYPERLEAEVYQFANGQSYTRGTPNGTARGGLPIGGALILAGEATPIFKHAGSRNRVLWLDSNTWAPFGPDAPRGTSEGERRAQLLEGAWRAGSGTLAPRVLEPVWRDWATFKADVQRHASYAGLAGLGAWKEPLAVVAVLLGAVFNLVECDVDMNAILSYWPDLLRAGHNQVDPAGEAWENLQVMLAQARLMDNATAPHTSGQTQVRGASWEWLEDGGGVIACRAAGEDTWRVPTNSPQFIERIGKTAAQEFGREWVRRGYVRAATDGKATDAARMYPRGVTRVLLVPGDQLPDA